MSIHAEHPFDILFPGLTILDLHIRPDDMTLVARATRTTADCPHCGTESTRVHSYYTRTPHDLPILGSTVHLLLHVRRWRCLNMACSARTFSEQLPDVLAPHAQRTHRLSSTLQHLAFALGGEAGARQGQRQAMPTSPDTLLRLTRQRVIPERATPRVLAVDDFAFRKGRTYGTLLVDGETHRPIDLLPERNATVLATWLREHPGVEVITRDRAPEYARGSSDGAPQALQVIDRWHLIGNLHEALTRVVDQLRPRLQSWLSQSPGTTDTSIPSPIAHTDRELRRGTKDQMRQQQRRAERYARYAEVKAFDEQGFNILQIARKLNISRQTVRRYTRSDQFPEISQKRRQSSILDPYVA